MSDSRPIILTALMEAKAQSFFDERRERYFPMERNWLRAHITLFHALPGDSHRPISASLARHAALTPVIMASVTGIRSLGRGVAYAVQSDSLSALRETLAREFAPWLTPQDNQKFSPHVTVQNKATRSEALRTEAILVAEFFPFKLSIAGVSVWRFDGGPWVHQADHAFRAAAA